MNLLNRNRHTDFFFFLTHRLIKKSLWLPKGKAKVKGAEINQEFEVNKFTLLYIQCVYKYINIKQIIYKVLLYGMSNSTQYSIIIYMGKESEKKQAHVYA